MKPRKRPDAHASILPRIGEKEQAVETLLAQASHEADSLIAQARSEARSRMEAAEVRIRKQLDEELAQFEQNLKAELDSKCRAMRARLKELEGRLDEKAEQAAKKIYPLILPNMEGTRTANATRRGSP